MKTVCKNVYSETTVVAQERKEKDDKEKKKSILNDRTQIGLQKRRVPSEDSSNHLTFLWYLPRLIKETATDTAPIINYYIKRRIIREGFAVKKQSYQTSPCAEFPLLTAGLSQPWTCSSGRQ